MKSRLIYRILGLGADWEKLFPLHQVTLLRLAQNVPPAHFLFMEAMALLVGMIKIMSQLKQLLLVV